MISKSSPALEGLATCHRTILGARIHALDYRIATSIIVDWARLGESRYVCIANTHSVVQAWRKSGFMRTLNGADLATSDGVPLVWCLKLLGASSAKRVYGPDLMLHVCSEAAKAELPIALFGGNPDTLNALSKFLDQSFPGIQIVCKIAPPYRPLTPEEDEAFVNEIKSSGARILFVGLGCPKQEEWMRAHKDVVSAVMLGVGAAFDFHAGRVRQAPHWMQKIGMEWFFRLLMEPRRLWKRYASTVPLFIVLFAWQYISHCLRPARSMEQSAT